MENAGKLDEERVNAARTQRMIDRIVGFRTSASIRKEKCEAAGRIQSVVLAEVVDRDNTIANFKPETYYEIFLPFKKNRKSYKAQYSGKLTTKKDADKVVKECQPGNFKVSDIKIKNRVQKAALPFTTSSLQQTAISKFGYSSAKISQICQSLFEGKTINGISGGLITYPRTDATRLSDEFILTAEEFITKTYGKNYYGGPKINKKTPSVGGAHAAMRPTNIKDWTPAVVKPFLDSYEFKIYELIYNRTLASLMTDAKIETTAVHIENNKHIFSISGRRVLFDGFSVIYDLDPYEELPQFSVGEVIKDEPLDVQTKYTNPPPKYNESSLIKFMENEKIARPSTYSATIENLKKHRYIIIEKKQISATDLGVKATKLMRKYFPDIMKISYTADLEEKIDKISSGESKYLDVLKDFYAPFHEAVLSANREIEKNKKPLVLLDEKCPECGNPLVKRSTKTGKEFLGCSKFPKCRYTASINDGSDTGVKCEKCGTGTLVKRQNKKGSIFYGCSEFSKTKCDFTMTENEFNTKYKKR